MGRLGLAIFCTFRLYMHRINSCMFTQNKVCRIKRIGRRFFRIYSSVGTLGTRPLKTISKLTCEVTMIFLLLRRIERAKRQAMLQSRPVLSDDDIYNQFYSNVDISITEASSIWHKIAEILHVNPGQLRPDDSFNDLLCLPKWLANCLVDSTDIDDLEYWTSTLKPNKNRLKCSPINTVDELMRYLLETMTKLPQITESNSNDMNVEKLSP